MSLAFPKPRHVGKPERRRIKAQSKRDSARLIRQADALARGLVLKRCGGKCESCGLSVPLDSAHGFCKKAYPAVRHHSLNLWGLCRKCHTRYGESWSEWFAFMGATLGLRRFETLRAAALGARPDLAEIVSGLKRGLFGDQRGA